MIIDKKFRKRGFGSFLMFFNNDTIIQLKNPSILICKDHLVHFYKRFGWTIMKNEHVNLKDHQASNDYKNSKVNCMGFNGANMKKTDYYLYKYF